MSSILASVSDLNRRAWFRLLKVLYVLAAIIVAFLLLGAALQLAVTEDQASINAAEVQKIWDSGTPVNQERPTGNTGFDWNTGVPISPSSLGGIPDVSQPPPPTYHEDWAAFALYAVIALLIEAALFEIVRRVFYYVLLGTPVWHRGKTAAVLHDAHGG